MAAALIAAGAAVAFDGAEPVVWVDRDSIGGPCSDERSAEEAASEASPWCTIERAVEEAPPGSTVVVRAGAYPEIAAGLDPDRTARVTFLSLRRQGSVDVARSLGTLTDTSGWHHIAATKNGAAVRLYLDGADVTNTSSIPGSVPAMLNTTSDLIIGRASNATAGFPGSIDEAAVYSRALSAAEILSHYRASGR